MKKILIWTIIVIVSLVGGFFLFQNYYATKLTGNWSAVFEDDFLKDNRLSVQKIRLIFDGNGTFDYEIDLASQGDTIQTSFNGTMTEKGSRRIKRSLHGSYYYFWPRVYVKFPPNAFDPSDSYDPFIIDRFSTDPATGETVFKLSALASFLGDQLFLQGTSLQEEVYFSRDEKGAHNPYILRVKSGDGHPRVKHIFRARKSL